MLTLAMIRCGEVAGWWLGRVGSFGSPTPQHGLYDAKLRRLEFLYDHRSHDSDSDVAEDFDSLSLSLITKSSIYACAVTISLALLYPSPSLSPSTAFETLLHLFLFLCIFPTTVVFVPPATAHFFMASPTGLEYHAVAEP